ncbi:MAG: TIGR01212 family radical SAM protein [Epulopiscium sp.]|nr:TIGR01212 family radical SAM protein [Candidatus Epulonipiscium sp.]
MKSQLYNKYSIYLKEKYGEKVYKIPINLPVTCPNRDGVCGVGGCAFCGEEGTGFEMLSNQYSIRKQLNENKAYIGKKYGAKKFIAYFQNFTNTYMPLEDFKTYMEDAIESSIVEIAISTRPDCINEEYLKVLQEITQKTNINISIELGLQTVNYHTLSKLNRGHGLAEFLDAVLRIKNYGFEVCTHLILNLPWDSQEDVIENAKILSIIGIKQVKLHALYIVKDTLLGQWYKTGEVTMISLEDYIERVICFLEYLDPTIVVQRLIGRAPKENTLFVNWDTSWWKIQDKIEQKMKEENRYQGRLFHYTNGPAVKHFLDE